MYRYFSQIFSVVLHPDEFFEKISQNTSWKNPIIHLLFVSFILSIGSLIAWSYGIAGDSPINSSLTVQMDMYNFWKSNLLPTYGFWSYPIAIIIMMLEMILITIVYVPIIFLIFRYLGGEKEEGGLRKAFQSFVFGLTPTIFGGFLPWLGLITGVYATILQLYRGPSITLKNKSVFSYILVVAVLTYAISRYWQGNLV